MAVFAVLAAATQATALEYQAQGYIRRFAVEDQDEKLKETYLFSTSVRGSQWSIETKCLEVEQDQAKGSVLNKMGSDGTDFFHIALYKDNSLGDPTLFTQAGTAFPGDYPVLVNTGPRLVWLALASGHYFSTLQGEAMPCLLDLEMSKDNLAPFSMTRLPSPTGLPTELTMTTPPFRKGNPFGQMYQPGYPAIVYKVTQVTNLGAFALPLQFRAEFYALDVRQQPPVRILNNVWVGAVTSTVSSAMRSTFVPEFTNLANITDKRFRKTTQTNFHLSYIDNKWLSRADANLSRDVDRISHKPPLTRPGSNQKPNFVMMTMLLACLFPAGLALRKYKKQTDQQQKTQNE